MTLEELYKVNPDFFNKDWHGKPMDGYTDVAVGVGWYELVAEVARNAPKGVYAQQIKEKFGSLTIYCGDNDPQPRLEFLDLIAKVEQESSKICENCGSKENVTSKSKTKFGWIKTYCQKCHGEINENV